MSRAYSCIRTIDVSSAVVRFQHEYYGKALKADSVC